MILYLGPFVSNGICQYETFVEFLKAAITLNSPLATTIKNLYFAAFRVSSEIVITVTRRLDGVGCENLQFHLLWRDYPTRLREMFKESIWKLAMDALNLNFLHWDIRPANIIFKAAARASTGECLSIIDWESGLNPFLAHEMMNSKRFQKLFEASKLIFKRWEISK